MVLCLSGPDPQPVNIEWFLVEDPVRTEVQSNLWSNNEGTVMHATRQNFPSEAVWLIRSRLRFYCNFISWSVIWHTVTTLLPVLSFSAARALYPFECFWSSFYPALTPDLAVRHPQFWLLFQLIHMSNATVRFVFQNLELSNWVWVLEVTAQLSTVVSALMATVP